MSAGRARRSRLRRLDGGDDLVGGPEPAARVVMITECSMSDNVASEFRDVEFVRPCNLCPHMKRITLAGIADALRHLRHEVIVPHAVAERARQAVNADARGQTVIAGDFITAPADRRRRRHRGSFGRRSASGSCIVVANERVAADLPALPRVGSRQRSARGIPRHCTRWTRCALPPELPTRRSPH